MNKLPLSSVENTNFGNFFPSFLLLLISCVTHFGGSIFLGMSPKKLSSHEKSVINGLKQLTEMIFKPHFQMQNEFDFDMNKTDKADDRVQSLCSNENDKTADGAMENAEQFCAMVIRNLTTKDDNGHDDWHHGQLSAYQTATERLFDSK